MGLLRWHWWLPNRGACKSVCLFFRCSVFLGWWISASWLQPRYSEHNIHLTGTGSARPGPIERSERWAKCYTYVCLGDWLCFEIKHHHNIWSSAITSLLWKFQLTQIQQIPVNSVTLQFCPTTQTLQNLTNNFIANFKCQCSSLFKALAHTCALTN